MVENDLKLAIMRTLSYFDMFDFPLTKEELFGYLWGGMKMEYEEFSKLMGEMVDSEKVGDCFVALAMTDEKGDCFPRKCGVAMTMKYGYYFLPGSESIIEKRREKLLFSEMKLKIALRAAKKISCVPFVRAIFVCNTVGAEQATEKSDIDFFIVTEPKRIWLVRFFTNLILRFFRMRSLGDKVRDRICLSFYVDIDHLDLSDLRIAPDDVYLAYWLCQLLPLYDADNIYQKLLEKNTWLKEYLPNLSISDMSVVSRLRVKNSKFGAGWKKVWEKMWQGSYGDLLEKQAKAFQYAKLKLSIKEKAVVNDKSVVISDGVLKFHENDRRVVYMEEWIRNTNDKR